ncbi:hypothetical protein ACFQH9_27155 [Pseudonocardia lutea]|jgi:hypothetical protein|uniref:Ig-like domain-containing protein n=1 Tax=Pseudonocardia lutea TaxID=2172015 RepID=A0ABW1IHX3_9PSEU
MPQKGLDPVQEDLPEPVRAVVTALREIYTEGPFDRLRQVEEAIVRARADHPGLVTVSSATCSRMLGPRRTSEGRSTLPRWPSVKAFLVVHGRDPEPFEARWTAAREAWAAGEDPEDPADAPTDRPGTGPAAAPSPPRRSTRRIRVAALVLAGLALFAAGTGFGLLLGAGAPGDGAPDDTVPVAPLALPGAAALAVPAGPTGVNCEVGGPGGDVRFLSVAADDGAPGIPVRIRVDLEVVRPAHPGRTYWLIARPFTEGLPFSAEAALRTDTGPASSVLTFDSPVGSVRDLFVVEADAGAGAWLQASHEHDGDGGGAQERAALPPGTRTVSATCRVERTR